MGTWEWSQNSLAVGQRDGNISLFLIVEGLEFLPLAFVLSKLLKDSLKKILKNILGSVGR